MYKTSVAYVAWFLMVPCQIGFGQTWISDATVTRNPPHFHRADFSQDGEVDGEMFDADVLLYSFLDGRVGGKPSLRYPSTIFRLTNPSGSRLRGQIRHVMWITPDGDSVATNSSVGQEFDLAPNESAFFAVPLAEPPHGYPDGQWSTKLTPFIRTGFPWEVAAVETQSVFISFEILPDDQPLPLPLPPTPALGTLYTLVASAQTGWSEELDIVGLLISLMNVVCQLGCPDPTGGCTCVESDPASVYSGLQNFGRALQSTARIELRDEEAEQGERTISLTWANDRGVYRAGYGVHFQYDRALLALDLPSATVVLDDGGADFVETVDERKLVTWIKDYGFRSIDHWFTDTVEIRIADLPAGQPYEVNGAVSLAIGPFRSSLADDWTTIDQMPIIYDFEQWSSTPDEAVWYTIGQSGYPLWLVGQATAPPSVIVTEPNAARVYNGRVLPIRWRTSGLARESFRIDIWYRVVGGQWNELLMDSPNASRFTWDVSGLPSGNYEVRVRARYGSASVEDLSDQFDYSQPGPPETSMNAVDLDTPAGEVVSLVGQLRTAAGSAVEDRAVDFEALLGGSWLHLASRRTNAYGDAALSVIFVTDDTVTVDWRACFRADPLFFASCDTAVAQVVGTNAQPPLAEIVSIHPSTAPRSPGMNVELVAHAVDPDDEGNPSAITRYRWTSDLGTVLGSTLLYDGTSSSVFLPAGDLLEGQHTITLRVMDNDAQWSAPVEGALTILPGSPEGNVIILLPSQSDPHVLAPGAYFCADISWDMEGVTGYNQAVGIEIQIAVETTSGWYISRAEEPFDTVQDRQEFCGLPTPLGTYTGPRSLRVQLRDAATSDVLVEAIEPNALIFDTQQDEPDFVLWPFPDERLGASPGSVQFEIHATWLNGFSAPVTLSLGTGLPSGITGSFAPNPLAGPAQASILTLDIPQGVAGSTYAFSVSGQGGGITRAAEPAPILRIPGVPLQVTLLDLYPDPSDPEKLAVHYRLDGTPGTYYHLRWQFLYSGSEFIDIPAGCIEGANPVACPGDHWLHWTMTCGADNLDRLEGTAFFRMQASSTQDGGLIASTHGTFPYQITGLTWDKIGTFYATTLETSSPPYVERIRRFNTNWQEVGAPCPAPSGWLWAVMYEQGRLWLGDYGNGNTLHPLSPNAVCQPLPCRQGADAPYDGPQVAGMMWEDIQDGNGRRPWFVEGNQLRAMNFDCYATPPEFTQLRRWVIPYQFASGITFDGNLFWISDAEQPKLAAFDEFGHVCPPGQDCTWHPAEDRDFGTAAFTGDGWGPLDVVYANGYLWAPCKLPPSGASTKIVRITPPVLSARTQESFPFDNNLAPSCLEITTPSGPQSGDVLVAFALGDRESDTLSVGLEYSTDAGGSWLACSLQGETTGIDPPYTASRIWESTASLPDYAGEVELRLTASDQYDPGDPCTTGSFSLVNEAPCQNEAPATPENVCPLPGQTNAPVAPAVMATEFMDAACNDLHAASEFEVRLDSGSWVNPTWRSGVLSPGTNWAAVPLAAGLGCETTYWWRCRYQDDSGEANSWSAWSPETRFTTGREGVSPGDLDCDRDVDLGDFMDYFGCVRGPGGGPIPPECGAADCNMDDEVDLHDFAVLQNAFTGTICDQPELAVDAVAGLPGKVAPGDFVTGTFDWGLYSGDGQPAQQSWTNVYGWRDADGIWAEPEPTAFYSGAPGWCPGHLESGETITIAAPEVNGTYILWAQAFPNLNETEAVAEFESTMVSSATNLAKILARVVVTGGAWDQPQCLARGGYWAPDGLGGDGCWFEAAENTSCDERCRQLDLTCADGHWNDDTQCTVLNHFVGGTCHCIVNEDPSGFCPAFWGGTPECGFRQNVDVDCYNPGYPGHHRICVCGP